MNMIYSLSNEYNPVIVFDAETGEYDWYKSKADEIAKNTPMSLHGDNIYEFFRPIRENLIHEEDRERFGAFYTLENMRRIAQTGIEQETENRWWQPDMNMYRWKYNKAVRMIDENGRVYIVVGVADTTEAKEREAQELMNAVLSEYLLRSYVTAYYTDINTGEINLLQSVDGVEEDYERLEAEGIAVNHDNLVDTYVSNSVHPDDAESFAAQMNREYIRKQLEAADSFSFTYRDVIRGADKGHFAAGFQDITKEVNEEREQQRRLAEALSMAESANRAKTTFSELFFRFVHIFHSLLKVFVTFYLILRTKYCMLYISET